MAKYCLTYDVQDSDKWEPNEIKISLSEILLKNNAFSLESPTASTILFEDGRGKSNITFWNNLIIKYFKEDIFYYLCVVGKNTNSEYLDRNEGDADLDTNYQDLLEELE